MGKSPSGNGQHDDHVPSDTNAHSVSRRNLLIGSSAAAAAAALSVGSANPAAAATAAGAFVAPSYRIAGDHRDDDGDLLLYNGKIHTMDDRNSVVDAVRIREGRIIAVGRAASNGSAGKKVDLRGRTVIPGLIESHTHFVSLAMRPGYHVAEWELEKNVAGVLKVLKARRKDVPPGQFITAMGAGTPRMFAEQRTPTLAELDSAIPDRPVFLYQNWGGPGRTNTLGKQFFESRANPAVVVGADGSIAQPYTDYALYDLRILQTFEDKERSALDAMAFSASIGLTTNYDQVLFATPNGTLDPSALDTRPDDGLRKLNHFRMYDAYLELHSRGAAFVRLIINYLHHQSYIPALGGLDKQLPELRERLKNQFPDFGDDMVRTRGIGEWAAPFATPASPDAYAVWFEAQRLVAQAGWHNENAQPTTAAIEQVVTAWEAVDAEFGIKDLRWGLQHADLPTADQLRRLKALGCGVSASGFRWLNSVPRPDGLPVGPLFKDIVASGIPMGIHEDGVHIAPHNPWYAIHYATTGLNVLGEQINPGQQITRQQALHAYTRGAAWFCGREEVLGSLEPGKLADLVVLDKDYFTVSDAAMRDIRPIMTVIDGQIVHDTGALRGKRDWSHDHNHRWEWGQLTKPRR